jgi:hypothetical protein
MTNLLKLKQPDLIDFGDLPEEINCSAGVAATQRSCARIVFRQALEAAPHELPTYLCLYKIHTYQGHLEEAQAAAESGLKEAARQVGWSEDWREWQPEPRIPDGAGRFALYTLKALAFIQLKQDNRPLAMEILASLRVLDPTGAVGWPVIAALAEGAA